MMANSPISGNRDFRLMVIGQIISILGSALLRFALSPLCTGHYGKGGHLRRPVCILNIPLLISL